MFWLSTLSRSRLIAATVMFGRALEEISYDLAVRSGRIPNTDAVEDMCCKLHGTVNLQHLLQTDGDKIYGVCFDGNGVVEIKRLDDSGEEESKVEKRNS
ncbi:unnamed protein product [Vicia faba]|uniref:Uncharacterized protein n=1 Tax=Vicia faba TaxID=3906 RepID=A0AAV0Z7R6_VICFA|nr:unnamed protein product [Vicia faba]